MPTVSSFPARCGLAILSGAVYALAYPPLGWGWLVIPGLAGLLVALQGQRGTRARAIGFLHGMSAYGIGLSWLYEIFGTLVIALFCVLAAFTALFAEMHARAAARGLRGWSLAAFTAVNWCGWEFIRAELFPLRFPWMSAGLALGPNTLLPWIGVYVVGAIVMFACAELVMRRWKTAWAPVAVLAAAVAFSSRHPAPDPDDPLTVKVAGLQMEAVTLTEFLKGTRELPRDIDHVVWPEYGIPYDIRLNMRDWKLVREIVEERDITLTFGTQLDQGRGRGWRNIALTVDPTGTRGEHTKVHTVHFFADGIPGTTALPVDTAHGKVGTPVCFDCDYEGVVRKMTTSGAETFIVPIMDAEAWTARQHEQHAALFRIRAAENGRWMFVCASSGVSQCIDPAGHVHSRLPVLAPGTLTGTLRRESGLTFYSRYGWLTPWLLLAIAVISWILLLIPGRRQRDVPTDPT